MKLRHSILPSNLFTAIAFTALGAANLLQAADFTWGGGNLDWTDTTAAGWNADPVPGAGDNATIGSGSVTVTTNVGILNTLNLSGTSVLEVTTGQLLN